MATKPKSSGKERKPSREDLERNLDEGLEESFPGSDPVAVTDPVVEILKRDKKK